MRIVQCFNWKLKDIMPCLKAFKYQGFDAIQINPIQPLKEEDNKEWWMSYQPIDFAIGNRYGSKEELIKLCNEAYKVGLRIYADVVINHMGASLTDSLTPHEKVNQKLKADPKFWRPKVKVSDWDNRKDVINHCIDLPGLNVYHKSVEDMIVKFLNELIDCGITGFRFDAAKSIGLPSEGYTFWPSLIYRLKNYNMFLYGEVIFEKDKRIIDEYNKYMYVLGNYDGTDIRKMVSFVESHDTFLSKDDLGYTRYVDSFEIKRRYLELVEKYEHTLFYLRPYDDTWKDEEIRYANLSTKPMYRVRSLR